MSIGIITHHDCLLHDMASGHPECPARISAIDRQIVHDGFNYEMRFLDAPKATQAQLARVHDADYIEEIFRLSPERGSVALDPDTLMTSFTLNAALRAAGAVVEAVELIQEGELSRAFCLVRPPGHHAERKRAMGFCIFNNIAVGVAHARSLGAGRIAIADFDVHHGNGTENIIQDMEDVLMLSSFQHPFYPHTGFDSKAKNVVNVPLPANTDGVGFRQAIKQYWLPALASFRPEWLFISAGFDAHSSDPLGGLLLTEEDYAWVTRELCRVSETYGEGRIVSSLEGGYHLESLGRSVCAHLDAMIEF
jgi:acetoin utilization deacetylase AcuC-like enzyme